VSQVLQTLEARLASLFGGRHVAERYLVACPVRLPVGVSMPNERIDPEVEHYPQPILGRTRDVSETGLSLVLPMLSLGAEQIDVVGYPLRVVLCLPGGLIIVQAETARWEVLTDEEGCDSYLVGALITRMSEPDRRRYESFLRSLA
jgi:hypothetical protein